MNSLHLIHLLGFTLVVNIGTYMFLGYWWGYKEELSNTALAVAVYISVGVFLILL